MIEILLVEDERFMRDALKALINWEECGYRIIGEAYNGREALKLLENQKPDIIVTDLKMPVMNGLELIKIVNEDNMDIRFVVLSAYDEFHLVREAFKLGVKEYILKSEIIPQKFMDALNKVSQELEEKRRIRRSVEEAERLNYHEKRDYERLRSCFLDNRLVIKENILKDIIWGENRRDLQKIRDFGELDLRLGDGLCNIMVLEVNNFINPGEKSGEDRLRSFKLYGLEVIYKVLDRKLIGEALYSTRGEYVVICAFERVSTKMNINMDMSMLYQELAHCFKTRFDACLSAGISSIRSFNSDLRYLYEEAKTAYRYGFIEGRGKLVFFERLPVNTSKSPISVQKRIDILKEMLKLMDKEALIENTSMLCISGNEVLPGQIDEVRELYGKYCFYIADFMENNNFTYEKDIQESICKFKDYLYCSGDLKEFNEWLRDILANIAKVIDQSNRIVNNLKTYIQKNYYKNLSLSAIADEWNVNRSSLSRAFSRETGISFTEYLTKVRMECAIQLVKDTDYKIYEISEMVGYQNPEHFSRVFKKWVGKSPREFMS